MIEIKQFVFNMIQTNCYVVWDETNEAVIIDAGCYYAQEKQALKHFVERKELVVKHYLNTHLHFDHIMGNPFVEETFGLKAEANDGDMEWLTGIKKRLAVFGIDYDEEPRPLGKILNEGDKVFFGTHEIDCLHVPGHSPGSLVYYIASENVLFSGDVLFLDSIGRTDFPDGNYELLREGILNKLFTLPAETKVYSGHGPATTIGYEEENNTFL